MVVVYHRVLQEWGKKNTSVMNLPGTIWRDGAPPGIQDISSYSEDQWVPAQRHLLEITSSHDRVQT